MLSKCEAQGLILNIPLDMHTNMLSPTRGEKQSINSTCVHVNSHVCFGIYLKKQKDKLLFWITTAKEGPSGKG